MYESIHLNKLVIKKILLLISDNDVDYFLFPDFGIPIHLGVFSKYF